MAFGHTQRTATSAKMDCLDEGKTLMVTFLIVSVLPVGVAEWRWVCGQTVCRADEYCESQINGGTCFKLSSRVLCSIHSYCYAPDKCCGESTCCPVGYTCKEKYCVADKRGTSGDEETTNGIYAAAAAIPGLIVIIVIIVFLCNSKRHDARPRNARARLVSIDSLLRSKRLPSECSRSSPGSRKSTFIHPYIVSAPCTRLVQADYNAMNTRLQSTSTESRLQATNTWSQLQATSLESRLEATKTVSQNQAASADPRFQATKTGSQHQATNRESQLQATKTGSQPQDMNSESLSNDDSSATVITMENEELDVQSKQIEDVHL